MIKFYNKIENKQFLAIVECLKRVCDFNYEGYDTSDELDEMNDFLDSISSNVMNGCTTTVCAWFNEIYDRWYNDCCSTLSAEVINKSFEAALNGKHYYDAADFLKDWDKEMVEYVLNYEYEFAIINDKYDYRNFLYKYDVIVQIPSGYFMSELDLWTDYKTVEENAAELLEDSVIIEFGENDDGDYIDDDGNVIDVKEEAKAYAEAFLAGIDYKDCIISRGE